MAEFLTCPFCGFEFEKVDTLCAHGCPLGALCHLTRCPSCNYEFPERPKRISWIHKLFRRGALAYSELPTDIQPITKLKGGDRATVLCMGGQNPQRHNTLAVFGLVPGSEVVLLQQRPSCVVRVGETDLALDAEIAREILVQRVSDQEPALAP